MENPFRPISISLSPNTQSDDVSLAWKLLWQPWKWQKGSATADLEVKFSEYLGIKHAYSFNSGRSSLMAVLDALALEKGSEVLLQAFTCNAAVNPIRWAGLEPVYVDCNDQYNIDTDDLKKKITPQSRAVMVQHTFGLPADIDEVKRICEERNLILIEDCAHSLGAEYKGRRVGTFGKVAFFSFSRDKIISCVYGGMAVSDDSDLAAKIKRFQEKCGYPGFFWTKQQLLHPVLLNRIVLPFYSIGGKIKLVLYQWLGILSKAIHWKEKRGLKPDYFPKRLPNALAILALNQFKKLDQFNDHRRKLAKFYFSELQGSRFVLPPDPGDQKQSFLRFAVGASDALKIIAAAWKRNLLIGDWYRTPVDPFDTKPETVGYKFGSCPKVESFCGKMINLPTHINISESQAKTIVEFIKKYDQENHR